MRPRHLHGGRPPSWSVYVVRLVNGTTADVYAVNGASMYPLRVVRYGEKVLVKADPDVPRAAVEAARRFGAKGWA